MRRRELIALAGGMAVWPLAARAQKIMPVIGFVAARTIKNKSERFFGNLRKGLAEYGYVEGQNFLFEFREANFQDDIYPILFRELVDQKVSLIIADSTPKLRAANAATQSIPIVFSIGVDPIESGFVASLNKPGGNLTGTYTLTVVLLGKRLEVLHELVPSAGKFAFLTDPGYLPAVSKLQMQAMTAAAASFGLSLLNVYAHTPDEFEAAFDTAVRGGAGGMVIGADYIFSLAGLSTQLAALAAHYRLPTIFGDDAAVKAGGLISYAVDGEENWRILGRYAGRILKGEKPADLPVMQSTKTILIINLKTAETLGITVPNSLLGRADEVIE